MGLINRLRQFVDSRLQPPYLAVVSGGIVAVSVALAAMLFITSDRGRTAFGIPLGADFAGFYVAAQILNQGQPELLYDRRLHYQLYHELLPHEDQHAAIPYVHPPFVAGFLRPLAALPYPTAVAIWLAISAFLYLAGLVLLFKVLVWPPRAQWWLLLLLAVSFEPFLYECWMGGQLSAIAFFSFAMCFAALQRGQQVSAGLSLGICFYKPTLLLLVLPMLLMGRRWRILGGMTLTGVALVALSLLLVGWNVNVSYLDVLLSFQKSTSGGDLEIRTWKYVDLNNCLRVLLGDGSPVQRPLLLVLGVIPFTMLSWIWWRYDRFDDDQRGVVWATTIIWIPVLNLYFGSYDSILIVQAWLIVAAIVCRNSNQPRRLIGSGIAYQMLAIYLAAWFSPALAAKTGVSVYTLLLMASGSFLLIALYQGRSLNREV